MSKLEWIPGEAAYSKAIVPFGQYQIWRGHVSGFTIFATFDGDVGSGPIDQKGRLFETAFEAQAACQSDYDAHVASIATANGYVKGGEETTAIIDAITVALAGCTDFEGNPPSKINYLQCIRKMRSDLEDATSTLDQIESESHLFHATAIASGYVKLEPGQVVVDERNYTLAMRMAAKWAEHVAKEDRGVTVTKNGGQ